MCIYTHIERERDRQREREREGGRERETDREIKRREWEREPQFDVGGYIPASSKAKLPNPHRSLSRNKPGGATGFAIRALTVPKMGLVG